MSRLYVGGLPHDCRERDLDDFFGRFGRITSLWIARNPAGFAFVEFEDERLEGFLKTEFLTFFLIS